MDIAWTLLIIITDYKNTRKYLTDFSVSTFDIYVEVN